MILMFPVVFFSVLILSIGDVHSANFGQLYFFLNQWFGGIIWDGVLTGTGVKA
jgi:hypothetical protein